MIGHALRLELRTVLRSPGRLALVAVFLVASGLAVAGGLDARERWEEAIAAAERLEEESVAGARRHLDAGEPGPPASPWVDLSEPLWQDWYAGTRLARRPAPLAGMAFASAEDGARVARIHRFADPTQPEGRRIENPELTLLGGLDLVAALVLLLPLVVIGLGMEIGGFERASGMTPLLRVQSGRDFAWFRARAVAAGALAIATGLVPVAAMGVVSGAPLGQLAVLALLVALYGAVWVALVMLVALRAADPTRAAITLGTVWLLLCVVVPSAAREASAALAADDYGLDVSLTARDLKYEIYDRGEEAVLDEVLERTPGLRSLPAMAVEERPAEVDRHLYDAVQAYGMERRARTMEERDGRYASLVGAAAALSPAVAMTRALERLAGRDSADAARLRSAAVEAILARTDWVLETAFRMEPLGRADFDALVDGAPKDVVSGGGVPLREAALLAAWLAIALLAAQAVSLRGRRVAG
ncbi:MAG: DUF3526 domain-containing protein [Planctomycetota bacterium]